MQLSVVQKRISYTVLVFLLLLVVGTPLFFTSLTRSVFEVNKLFLLRFSTLAVMGIWFFHYLFLKDNGIDHEKSESYSFFGLRWKKIGLEIPMLLWLFFNVLSTLFSQNLIVSVIGAYDRWEGLVTIINYGILWFMFAKWVTSRTFLNWLLAGILVSTTISAIYGIVQSFGFDFMPWSVNPTLRVFGCINNPVHYCAYLAMVVPIMIGWLVGLPNYQGSTTFKKVLKITIFVSILLTYYAQYLSFSRATWLGFCAAMTMFYLVQFNLLSRRSQRRFFIDFFITLLTVGLIYVLYIFKAYLISIPVTAAISVWVGLYLIYSIREVLTENTFTRKTLLGIVGILFAYIFHLSDFHFLSSVFNFVVGAGVLVSLHREKNPIVLNFFLRLLIIVFFARLQFIPASLFDALVSHPLLVLSVGVVIRNLSAETIILESRKWLILVLLCLGVVISIPALPGHLFQIFKQKESVTITAAQNAQSRSQAYKMSLEGHSARYSMWKSALPWIRDYWLLGSGPDTVKYMYPDYRRPDYGILEGGHNFTPDRLHNEYLNTLATRGIPATIIFYFGLILGWYWLTLSTLYRFKDTYYFSILMGLISAATVYLGQIFFNFGVVATLVLFYIFVGMAHAIVANMGEGTHNV